MMTLTSVFRSEAVTGQAERSKYGPEWCARHKLIPPYQILNYQELC